MRINSKQGEMRVKELITYVENAMSSIEDYMRTVSCSDDDLKGLPDTYRNAIERGMYAERSCDELRRLLYALKEASSYFEAMNEMQVIYGPPPFFDKLES